MLDAIDGKLKTMDPTDPDRGGLVALRDAITGAHSADADPTRALADPTTSTARQTFEECAPRTKAERAAMEAELQADLKGKVLVEEAPLPPGVVARVVYDTEGVRIEVRHHARPEDVRSHVQTARYLQRYVGLRGAIRRLVERIHAFVTGSPAVYGGAGFEANLEIAKPREIETQVRSEMETLCARGGDPAELEGRLSDLYGQIAEYEDALHSAEHGRG